MDMEKVEVVAQLAPLVAIIAVSGVLGWVITTWMRIKHGYPLENSWGKAVYPKTSTEEMERIKLLSNENAQLRAELGSVKDRLATLERIVTDEGYHLTQEIKNLRNSPSN